MPTITMGSKKNSLFDDIFRLQSTAPELDVDPEDLQDGLKASLVDATDEAEEDLGPSKLRRRTAVISDDPKYKGKRASRKDLYSDEEEAEENGFDASSTQEDSDIGQDSGSEGQSDEGMSQDASGEEDGESEEGEDSSGEEDGGVEGEEGADAKIMEDNKSDDREKGKAVHGQLDVWDQLIKTRISMHKVLSLCNQLPNVDTWPHFSDVSEGFSKEAANAHSSVRNLVSTLLEVQKSISGEEGAKRKALSEEDDEEVTSDDEGDDDDEGGGKTISLDALDRDDPMSDMEEDEDEEEEESTRPDLPIPDSTKKGRKRKLDVDEVEDILSKQHTSFQKYRNDTLSKWDEKTRLTHGKVKSKNFAAFEMSVLKQIEQVLVNRERLIRRIHQQRTAYRILGCPEAAEEDKRQEDAVVDDDDDVEVEMKQRSKQEVPVNPEVIDDNDFYHVCLRDFIEMKQNEETDPVMANKQWLEIQRLRNKQKRKVDTRASKGRKIRYNIREKLKNFMTPYDKSIWADEQKDDLYKALFGGHTGDVEKTKQSMEAPTINIGL